MNRLSAVTVVVIVTALACGGTDDATVEARSDGADASAFDDSVAPGADSNRSASPDTSLVADPFTGFELDAEPANAVERRISLQLRNHDARTAVVYADGGAGEVLLDSVPPGSDIRVDILTRATTIALRSVAPDGALLRETDVSPGLDTIVDVIVGPAPAAP